MTHLAQCCQASAEEMTMRLGGKISDWYGTTSRRAAVSLNVAVQHAVAADLLRCASQTAEPQRWAEPPLWPSMLQLFDGPDTYRRHKIPG